jgi:hypothetical protein
MDENRKESDNPRVFEIRDTQPDHRTIFTFAEVEAAFRKILPDGDAREAAEHTMNGPFIAEHPAFFPDGTLDLLSELSEDVARRVRLVRGHR